MSRQQTYQDDEKDMITLLNADHNYFLANSHKTQESAAGGLVIPMS